MYLIWQYILYIQNKIGYNQKYSNQQAFLQPSLNSVPPVISTPALAPASYLIQIYAINIFFMNFIIYLFDISNNFCFYLPFFSNNYFKYKSKYKYKYNIWFKYFWNFQQY